MDQRRVVKGLVIASLFVLMLIAGQAMAASGPAYLSSSPALHQEQATLMNQLRAVTGSKVQMSTNPLTGKIRYMGMSGSVTIPQPSLLGPQASPEAAARGFLSTYGPLLGIKDQKSELTVMRTRTANGGRSFVRFQQVHSGIPILGGEMIVQVASSKDVISAHSKILPDLSIDTTPNVSPEAAAENAIAVTLKTYGDKYSLDSSSLEVSSPDLWIYSPVVFGINHNFPRLVWRMEVTPKELLPIRELVLVDAQLGVVALHFNQIDSALSRKIYDHNNVVGKPLPGDPGDLKRSEGDPASGITDVDNAYLFAGDTYTFYWNYLWRDSLDNAGMQLISTTRYCPSAPCPYANAFWNGSQMVYGDGYASADDVVGHEMTHGVTEYESKLFYYMQSGAINEALSDIFGEFIDLTNEHGNDNPSVRWLMGEDLSIGAIRSMKNPPDYSDPDKVTSGNFYCGWVDNGGVHTNSGVANKAAYLITDGDTFNGITVTGLGITKAAKIFYEAQTSLLTSASDYSDLYDALRQACLNLVGTSSIVVADCQQVENAVNAVEMNQQPPACQAQEAPVCESGHEGTIIFFDNLENPGSGKWTSAAIYAPGGNQWYYPQNPNPYNAYGWDPTYATSGQYNFWGDNYDDVSDSYIGMTSSTSPLPARAYLRFSHAYGFEYNPGVYYDGGVIEYSTNNGTTWKDAGFLITRNGYTGTVETAWGNPLGGRRAFVASSNGYISTRLDLGTLVGQSVRFRFRMGTDSLVDAYGWFIDDIRIYTCEPAVCSQQGFRDDFNFTSGNWVDDGKGLWSVSGGNYESSGSAPPSIATATVFDNATYCDFTYEARLRRTAGSTDAAMGVLFRTNSPDLSAKNGYGFFITAYGGYGLYKYTSGLMSPVIDWIASAFLNTGLGAWNTLKVEASGSTIKIYANGTLLGSVTDSSYSSGKVGLLVADKPGTSYTVEYDYTEVSNIPVTCSQYPFHDEFDGTLGGGGSGNWTDDGSGRWSFSGEKYVMTGTDSETWTSSLHNNATYCDFTYEVKVQRTAGSLGTAVGMVFRGDNTYPLANGYHFVIAGSAGSFSYSLFKMVSGTFNSIVAWTVSSAINAGLGTWNTLRAEASGSTIKLYANGVLLKTVTDPSFSSGKVGVVLYDGWGPPNSIVEYEYAEVSGLPYACSEFGFREDFNDGVANNWFDDGKGMWSVVDGMYRMTGAGTGSGTYTFYDTSYCDFTYQAKVSRGSNPLYIVGLPFRAEPSLGNWYSFDIGHLVDGGHYALTKRTGTVSKTLIESVSSAIHVEPGSSNILKVEASGSTIKLFANGTLLNTVNDPTFSSGKVGLYALDPSSSVVEFDFVEVTDVWGCNNAIPLTAGVAYDGTTVGGPSVMTFYGTLSATLWAETGPEKIHRITTYATGTIQAALTNEIDNTDVFILDACDPSRLAAYGGNTATYNSAPPGTYYVVVDGWLGASGSYTLTVTAPHDTAAPTGSIVINGGAAYTSTASVSLTISATDTGSGVSLMRFSNDGSAWSDWEVYNTTKAWILDSVDGTRTVYVQFQDNAGNSSGSFTDAITLDSTGPTGTISINSGAAYTATTSVTLTLSASDGGVGVVSQMRFSNDGGSWSLWETYGMSKPWTLASGDGTKTVYVQYKDAPGNSSGSYSDTITLDTVAPGGSVDINAGAAYTNTISVTLTLFASDGSGSGISQMQFSNDMSTWSGWEAYGTSKLFWPLSVGDGTKTVYVQYKDVAGNVSNFTDTIVLDTVAPTGSIAINGGPAYTNTTSVALTLSAADGGSGVSQMQFSNDGNSWSGWKAYGTSKVWTLTTGDGTKTVYVQYKDNAGNGSSSYSTTVVLDTGAPTGSIVINGGDPYTNTSLVTLTLSSTDGGGGSGVYQMRFSNDGSAWSSWEAYGTSNSWMLISADGTRTVYVQYKDNIGNGSESFLDSIILDTEGPTPGTIAINRAAATTISLTVTLNSLGASDLTPLTQMMFSNNSSGPWSSAETYAGTKAGWDLSLYGGSSAAGTKTVYVKYQDSAGNWSAAFSDTIYYQPMQVFPFMDDFSTEKGWYGYEVGGWERKPAHTGGGTTEGNADPGTDYTDTSDNYILGYAIGADSPADYTNDLSEKAVISPPVDCTGRDQVFLKFRRWLNVESRKASNGGDHARIYVSTDGVSWGDPVWENPGYDFTDDQWTQAVIDITDIAADKPTVYIKFTMGPTNWTRPFSGWNIDDLEVTSESIYPVEGTIGTSVQIPGNGFGLKKGKALIGTAALKIVTWGDNAILGTISKVLPPDAYDFTIQPKVGSPIIHDAFFSMKPPEIDEIKPASGSNPDEITITGKYFGTKKGKVLLGYAVGGEPKTKSCKVTYWWMDPLTGESTVKFIVPAKLPTGPCDLTITNKVGTYREEDGFKIE